MKKYLSFLLVVWMLCLMSVPGTVSAAAEPISLEYHFDTSSDLQSFDEIYKDTASLGIGSSGDGLQLTVRDGNYAAIRLPFGECPQGLLTVEQTICLKSGTEAQIRILANGGGVFVISLTDRQLKALGKNGWVPLRACGVSTWYNVKILADVAAQTYEVMINGVKLGGSLSYTNKATLDCIQYSVAGKSGVLLVDDIAIHQANTPTSVIFDVGGASEDNRNAYYTTYKPYLDLYDVPTENIVEHQRVGGLVSTSGASEEYPAENLLDGDASTKWQVEPPVTPKDNGKSLRLMKPEVGDTSLAMQYTFPIVKSDLIVEQDVLFTDTSGQKALPYVYSSNGDLSCTLIQSGGKFQFAGGGPKVYRDVIPDTWYTVKLVMSLERQATDIYINGELIQSNISFRERVSDFTRLRYHMNTTELGGFCLDNLKISYTTPLGSMEEIVYQQDFESFAEGTEKPDGWGIGKATGGKIDVGTYTMDSQYKFTQYVNIDLERESEVEGVYLRIPDGIGTKFTVDIDRNGGTVYATVLDKRDQYYTGEQILYFSPVRGFNLRVTLYDAVDVNGNQTFAQLSEMRVILKHRTPVDNLAFYADVAVSGEVSKAYDKRGINDNIIAEFGCIGDWHSGKEEDKWVELSWAEPKTVSRVILHDSARYDYWTKAGILSFDDGSGIEVTDIKNTGYPKDITFEPKTVKKLRFTITDYEGNVANLSEFQVFSPGGEPDDIEYVEPDMRVIVPKEYCSRVVCVNDIDKDNTLEFISPRIYDDPLFSGNHYCSSILVQKADGTVLWTWGDPAKGSKNVGSDIPIQVYDLDRDGIDEVIACDDTYLYVLDGLTGAEEAKHLLPKSQFEPGSLASDCIIIADISGNGYASDIMVKTRYGEVWAYTKDWKLIWYVDHPDGFKVGHFPQPIDIDNDGHDEVIVGFSCIDEDGSSVWAMKESQYPGFLSRGHKDSLDIINFSLTGDTTEDYIINEKDLNQLKKHIAGEITLTGNKFTAGDTDGNGVIDVEDRKLLEQKLRGELKAFPNKGIPREEQRFCISPCGGGSNIIMFDGNGNRIWALDDAVHYETVEKANLGLDEHPFQIVTGDNAQPSPASQLMYVSLDGEILGVANSFIRNRQFNPINWTGEGGLDYIFMPTDNVVVDGHFKLRVKPLAPYRGYDSLGMKSYQTGDTKYTCDMDGDGTTDIGSITQEDGTIMLYIYFNKNGAKVADGIGRGYNISQY